MPTDATSPTTGSLVIPQPTPLTPAPPVVRDMTGGTWIPGVPSNQEAALVVAQIHNGHIMPEYHCHVEPCCECRYLAALIVAQRREAVEEYKTTSSIAHHIKDDQGIAALEAENKRLWADLRSIE